MKKLTPLDTLERGYGSLINITEAVNKLASKTNCGSVKSISAAVDIFNGESATILSAIRESKAAADNLRLELAELNHIIYRPLAKSFFVRIDSENIPDIRLSDEEFCARLKEALAPMSASDKLELLARLVNACRADTIRASNKYEKLLERYRLIDKHSPEGMQTKKAYEKMSQVLLALSYRTKLCFVKFAECRRALLNRILGMSETMYGSLGPITIGDSIGRCPIDSVTRELSALDSERVANEAKMKVSKFR